MKLNSVIKMKKDALANKKLNACESVRSVGNRLMQSRMNNHSDRWDEGHPGWIKGWMDGPPLDRRALNESYFIHNAELTKKQISDSSSLGCKFVDKKIYLKKLIEPLLKKSLKSNLRNLFFFLL